jgi:4-hydroxy-3-polyprenylbenzoate decarboxylase
MHKLIVAIGGASGSIYAKQLLDRLAETAQDQLDIAVVATENAKLNWQIEIGDFQQEEYPHFHFFENNDFNAPFASGSAKYMTMIVVPCSMGLLGRIATGVSSDLITRASDVILKERRRLILVPRETPLSLIHLNNMKLLTEAGAIICPAVPSFYHKPTTVLELVDTVVVRVLDLAGVELDVKRWGDL